MNVAEQFEVDGLTVKICWDDDPQHSDPRDNCNLGTMVCWHPDYYLGDEQFKDGDGRGAVKNAVDYGHVIKSMRHLHTYLRIFKRSPAVLPLSIYDHSGVSMYVGGRYDFAFDTAGWDTTHVGFIYTTPERIRELCGDDPKYLEPDWVEKQLRSEVREYDSFLRGEVYGYIVEHEDGEHLDSCWGFVGDSEYVKQEATEAAQYWAKERREAAETERKEKERWANQDVPTTP